MENSEYIKSAMLQYPFDFWFSDRIPLSSLPNNQKQMNAWAANAIAGVMATGGLLSIFEEGWGQVQLSSIPERIHATGAQRAAELLKTVVDQFPTDIINDLEQRRLWAWGKAPGSESMPGLIESFQSDLSWECLTLPSVICTYIIANIGDFPNHAAWLRYYLDDQSGKATIME